MVEHIEDLPSSGRIPMEKEKMYNDSFTLDADNVVGYLKYGCVCCGYECKECCFLFCFQNFSLSFYCHD